MDRLDSALVWLDLASDGPSRAMAAVGLSLALGALEGATAASEAVLECEVSE